MVAGSAFGSTAVGVTGVLLPAVCGCGCGAAFQDAFLVASPAPPLAAGLAPLSLHPPHVAPSIIGRGCGEERASLSSPTLDDALPHVGCDASAAGVSIIGGF
jgi:hypothetical protein